MPQHDDSVRLRHMLDHALAAQRIAAGRSRSDLESDETLQLALTRAVEIIGEAASRVSQASREVNPAIPWGQIIGTRNRLIHGYDAVNLDILWSIVTEDIPPLIARLKTAVGE